MDNTLQITNRKTESAWTPLGLVVVGKRPAYSMKPYRDPPTYQQVCPVLLWQSALPKSRRHHPCHRLWGCQRQMHVKVQVQGHV